MALLDPQNNRIILFILMIALFIFIMSNICTNEDDFENLENTENNNKSPKIDLNRCSKQCCAQTQWTLPAELRINDMTPEEASKYIPNNFSCNLGSGSGCLCVTKDDFNYLAGRGNNVTNNTCSK
jgi:hypothetical protein